MAITYGKPVVDFTSASDATSYTHGSSYTPTADTYQTIIVSATATNAVATMTGGSGWTSAPALITSATFNAGASTLYLFGGLAGASPGSWTPVFDCTGDGATGCMMVFAEWTGFDTSTPIRQTKVKSDTVGSNPTITLDSAVLTTSGGMVAIVITNSNPANIACDATISEVSDIGHSSPTCGLEVAEWESGITASTFTATRTSVTHGIIAFEIQVPIVASTPSPGGTLLMMGV